MIVNNYNGACYKTHIGYYMKSNNDASVFKNKTNNCRGNHSD